MTAASNSTQRATTPSGDPIMTAKYLVPAVTAPVVPRPRLFERLTAGVRGPLTLVSAPAGSGKTVLIRRLSGPLGVPPEYFAEVREEMVVDRVRTDPGLREQVFDELAHRERRPRRRSDRR